jgi:hypothetical protein
MNIIGYNRIGNNGVAAIGEALKDSKTFNELNLGN